MCAMKSIPDTQWVLEFSGNGFDSLSVVERPVPHPGPHQVLCRVEAASVCSIDVDLIRQGSRHPRLFGWNPERWPIVVGHEGSLVVAAVGKGLGHQLRVGQRLVLIPDLNGPPRFDLERYGESPENICRLSLGFTLPGLISQYVLLREDILDSPENVIQITTSPSSLPHFGAALAESFATVVAAQARIVHVVRGATEGERTYRGGVLPGGVAVVIGAGPMGLMHVSYALLRRPRHMVVSEPNPERRAGADRLKDLAEMGSTELHTVKPDELTECVRGISGSRGADDIIFAVGDARVEEEVLRLAAPGSCVSFYGKNPPEQALVRVNAVDLHFKSIALSGSAGSEPQDLRRALELQERGAVDMSPFVSAVAGISAAPTVLRSASEGRFGGKVVIYPHAHAPEVMAVEEWGPDAEERFLSENP